jgi:hypothetical protein
MPEVRGDMCDPAAALFDQVFGGYIATHSVIDSHRRAFRYSTDTVYKYQRNVLFNKRFEMIGIFRIRRKGGNYPINPSLKEVLSIQYFFFRAE